MAGEREHMTVEEITEAILRAVDNQTLDWDIAPEAVAASLIRTASILASSAITILIGIDAERRPGEGIEAMADRLGSTDPAVTKEIADSLDAIAARLVASRRWIGTN